MNKTTYSAAMLAKAKAYVASYKSQRIEERSGGPLSEEAVPTIAGLALHLGKSRPTIYNWAKEKGRDAFKAVLEEIELMQEVHLVTGGLRGDFNPSVAKMMLGRHGYSDATKSEVDDHGSAALAAALMAGMAADEASKIYSELLGRK